MLSRITSWPGRRDWRIVSVALSTYERSGSLILLSGVGTQIEIASHSARRDMSVVAVIRPSSVSGASSDDGTSPMWLSPAFTRSATDALTSNPSTRIPGPGDLDGQREADVPEPDHADDGVAALDPVQKGLQGGHACGWGMGSACAQRYRLARRGSEKISSPLRASGLGGRRMRVSVGGPGH